MRLRAFLVLLLVIWILLGTSEVIGQQELAIAVWDGGSPSDFNEYASQFKIAAKVDPGILSSYVKVRNGETILVWVRLSTLARLAKIAGTSIEIVSSTDPLFLHPVGNSIGPGSVGSAYNDALVATLYGRSQSDANALLHAISNAASCVNPVVGCTLFDEDDPRLIDRLQQFLKMGESEGKKEIRIISLTASERKREQNRNWMVQGLLGLKSAKLLSIPADVIVKMQNPPFSYAVATIPAKTYTNSRDVTTAQDASVLAGQPGWRNARGKEYFGQIDTLNKAIFGAPSRFSKSDGRRVAQQIFTVVEESKGLITLDPKFRALLFSTYR